jgi:hypothetical protein
VYGHGFGSHPHPASVTFGGFGKKQGTQSAKIPAHESGGFAFGEYSKSTDAPSSAQLSKAETVMGQVKI